MFVSRTVSDFTGELYTVPQWLSWIGTLWAISTAQCCIYVIPTVYVIQTHWNQASTTSQVDIWIGNDMLSLQYPHCPVFNFYTTTMREWGVVIPLWNSLSLMETSLPFINRPRSLHDSIYFHSSPILNLIPSSTPEVHTWSFLCGVNVPTTCRSFYLTCEELEVRRLCQWWWKVRSRSFPRTRAPYIRVKHDQIYSGLSIAWHDVWRNRSAILETMVHGMWSVSCTQEPCVQPGRFFSKLELISRI